MPNALGARIVADLGFKAVYLTGAGLTNMYLGLPDLGFMDLSQVAGHVMAIRSVIHAIRDHTVSRLQLAFVEAIRLGLVDSLTKAGWTRLMQVSHARVIQALNTEIHQIGIDEVKQDEVQLQAIAQKLGFAHDGYVPVRDIGWLYDQPAENYGWHAR